MAKKPLKRLNDRSAKIINKAFLDEKPEDLPDHAGLVLSSFIPTMRHIVFLNGRDPGVALQFHYHSKTHPLKQYTLYHGFEYDLPEEIIDHLENCRECQYGHKLNVHGVPEHFVKGYKYIFQCRNKKAA